MEPQSYTPDKKTLEKYARLIVHFGCGRGKGPKKGDVVRFSVPEVARPLYFYLHQEILKAGAIPLGNYIFSDTKEFNVSKSYYDNANKNQLAHFPEAYIKGLVDELTHNISIIAESDPHALKSVDPKKIMERSLAYKPFKDWLFGKIDGGKAYRTVALYGTDAAAKEAGMSTKQYWDQIIKACYLDKKDPVKEWHRIDKEVKGVAGTLNQMNIEWLHFEGKDMNLHVQVGKDRAWKAGGGDNIPSYEVFTSPNYRGTYGWIKPNQPHYRYGKAIEGIELEFKKGVVTKFKARKNQDLLASMLKTPGGNRLGEVSMTDARLSRISKFMAEILFDENMGGKYGNMHIAIGSAYRECFKGDKSKMNDKKWDKIGFNDSVVHSDVISTTDRTVIATLQDGSQKLIYKKGKFVI